MIELLRQMLSLKTIEFNHSKALGCRGMLGESVNYICPSHAGQCWCPFAFRSSAALG